LLKDYGLERIEFSAFYGSVKRQKAEELFERIERLIEEEDIVHVFFLSGKVDEVRTFGSAHLPSERDYIII
jgi:CRISPR-associated endonuclease Cas2